MFLAYTEVHRRHLHHTISQHVPALFAIIRGLLHYINKEL